MRTLSALLLLTLLGAGPAFADDHRGPRDRHGHDDRRGHDRDGGRDRYDDRRDHDRGRDRYDDRRDHRGPHDRRASRDDRGRDDHRWDRQDSRRAPHRADPRRDHHRDGWEIRQRPRTWSSRWHDPHTRYQPRWEDSYRRGWVAPAAPRHHGIPSGLLPAPGTCRVWYPGTPPGHQPPPTSCDHAWRTAPAGTWVVYRPWDERSTVQVWDASPYRAGHFVRVRVYDLFGGGLRAVM